MADEREQAILDLFHKQWAKDGECELDEGTVDRDSLGTYAAQDGSGDHGLVTIPIVSEGDDNGAYVRAWVWVDFEGTGLDKNDEDEDE